MIRKKNQLLFLLFTLLVTCISVQAYGQNRKSKSGKIRFPIDGEWTNAWNEKVMIEDGRLYKLMIIEVAMKKIKVELEIIRNINQMEPGLYSAFEVSDYDKKIFDYPVTIKIIDENKIIISSERQDIVYSKIKLHDNKSYLNELALAQQNYINSIKNKITFLNLSIEPDFIVPNQNFTIYFDYKVYFPDIKEEKLELSFNYEIQKNDKTLFRSAQQSIEVSKDADMHREVKLKASADTGKYQINIYMSYDTCVAKAEASFRIINPDMMANQFGNRRIDKSKPFIDQITGRYKIVISGWEDHSNETMTFSNVNDSLHINFEYKPKNVEITSSATHTTYKSMRLLNQSIDNFILTYTVRIDATVITTGNFPNRTTSYSIYKFTIDLNQAINEAPVEIKPVEGEYVQIGEVLKGKLIKIE